jgi:formylglycine-generating enzyme required for sulfatase activity
LRSLTERATTMHDRPHSHEAQPQRLPGLRIALASGLFVFSAVLVSVGVLARAAHADNPAMPRLAALAPAHIEVPTIAPRKCPGEMAEIGGRFCVDRWEATTEIIGNHGERIADHSPFHMVLNEHVRAVSRPGVHPQGHISRNEADLACQNAGKRLCTSKEWVEACRGPDDQAFPYGEQHDPGACNDNQSSPLVKLYGKAPPPEHLGYHEMNHPGLNQQGGLALTGSFARCENGFGVFDMVGNLHEWTADKDGVFRGGYYRDTTQHGDGCRYKTTVHGPGYRDYSTGFRCCADATR